MKLKTIAPLILLYWAPPALAQDPCTWGAGNNLWCPDNQTTAILRNGSSSTTPDMICTQGNGGDPVESASARGCFQLWYNNPGKGAGLPIPYNTTREFQSMLDMLDRVNANPGTDAGWCAVANPPNHWKADPVDPTLQVCAGIANSCPPAVCDPGDTRPAPPGTCNWTPDPNTCTIGEDLVQSNPCNSSTQTVACTGSPLCVPVWTPAASSCRKPSWVTQRNQCDATKQRVACTADPACIPVWTPSPSSCSRPGTV